MKKIILNKYKRERDSELSITVKRVIEKTDNNPKFLNPPEALAKLKKLLPEYDNSVVNAKGRDKEMVAIKKAKKAEVVTSLTEVANYIALICNGDEAMLLSSGFDISGQTGLQEMPAILKLEVWLGHPGEVTTRIKRVAGARAYMHQYTTEPPTSDTLWISEGSTNANYTFRGLKSYVKYWFRVAALGTGGQTVYSPVDARIVQ